MADLWAGFVHWAPFFIITLFAGGFLRVLVGLVHFWQTWLSEDHIQLEFCLAVVVLVVILVVHAWRRSQKRFARFDKGGIVNAQNDDGHPAGTKVVMGFRRQCFTWTSTHIPGRVLDEWQQMTDAADAHFRPGVCVQAFRDSISEVAELPSWVDKDLLDEGCRFFVQTWPFVFFNFGWALLAGFGAESASAVLLQSRYWAAHGDSGRIDSWNRLRETACWLYDVAAHGAEGFAPGGVSWKACLLVRWLHCRTRATIWAAGSWDKEKFGQPINQVQLIGTLLGSSVLLLDGMEELLGLPLPRRKKEAFIHLWRVIGFLFGISDDINPNTSYERSKIVMESVFTHGIPALPDPNLTAVLTQHICESIAHGLRTEFGAPVTGGIVAASPWFFVGAAYGEAIGLPKSSRSAHMVAFSRRCMMRGILLTYLLPGAPYIFERVMGYLFAAMVNSVRKRQPHCRFGVVCPVKLAGA